MNAILPKSRADWHELRAQHIGGSEIASLFYLWQLGNGQLAYLHMFERPPAGATMLGCVSRHTTGYRLYHQKAGVLPAEDLDGNERIRLGRCLEAGIAEAARDKWAPWPLRKVHRYLRHAAVPGMGASRDFEVHEPGLPPVEIKNVDYLVFRDLWKAKGDNVEAPPIDITLQLQHQMACERIHASHGWIIACVGGSSLKRGRIERHQPTIAKIEQAVTAFWRAIEAGMPPLDVADFDTVADISLLSCDAKAAPLDLTLDNRLPTLCARYRRLDGIEKRAADAKDRVKAEIALKLGDGTRAKAAGFTITWPLVQRGEKSHRGGMSIREV